MAYLALSPVSVAVFNKLNVSGMTALVSTRIYDAIPQAATLPLVFYEVQEQDVSGMGTVDGLPEVEIMVHTLSAQPTMAECQTVSQKAIELLRNQTLTVTGYDTCSKVFYDRTEKMPEWDYNGVPCRELVSRFVVFVEES